MKGFFISFALVLAACGNMEFKTGNAAKPDEAQPTATPTTNHFFTGSVSYAFELSVDGQKFTDIESYYTATLEGLLDKVVAAGHNADAVDFAGKLGFHDFVQDMDVFVASSRGSQGRGKVDAHGNFSVEVPVLGNEVFRVRAVKRVQILLLNAGVVTQKMCFNFSAVEKDVVENPILLDTFTTDHTLYDCSQEVDGLKIPESAAQAAVVRGIQACGPVTGLWTNGFGFVVGACGKQQEYVLPRDLQRGPITVGEPATTEMDPEGFKPFSQKYNAENKHVVPLGLDLLHVTDYGNTSFVAVERNGIVLKSFTVPFGLGFLAVDGQRVFALARVAQSNSWKVGELELSSNRFVPRGDGPSGLTVTMAGTIDGSYTLVHGDAVTTFTF